uniref:MxcH n=1 Tax=Stigmatella aurantiaca TaxID=41 RepID=Q9F634_STIAU|nr:MxcH [Stigmatella aurantiaca Sg a15]
MKMRSIFIVSSPFGTPTRERALARLCRTALLAALLTSRLAQAQEQSPERATPQAPSGSAPAPQPSEAPPAAPVVEMPKLLEIVEAIYPAQAKQDRLEAKVALRLTLDAQGVVKTAEVLGPVGHGFDEAAQEAALRFRFEPAKRNGTTVPARVVYTYEFRLPPPPTPPSAQPSGQAAASESSDSSFGETIEVSAGGESVAQRRRQSAEAVQVLEVGTLQREAVDLGEALARTEGVSVRRSGGLGSTSRFSIAGLTDEQIRFFIDGVPLELAGYGAGLANVPVNLVQRVETYQGVVPIRFGADALGGAVHLETDQNFQGLGASASYEFGSFDTHRLTASIRQLHEPTGFLLRASGFFDTTRNDYLVDVEVEAADGSGRPVRARVHRFHDGYRAGGAGIEAGFVDQSWARRLLLRVFTGTYDKDLQNDIEMSAPYGEVEYGETSGGSTLRFEQIYSNGLSVDAIAGYTYRRNHLTDLSQCVYDWYGRCILVLPQPGVLEGRPIERTIGQHTGFARLNFGWNVSPSQKFRLSLAPTFVDRAGEDRQLQEAQQLDPLDGERNLFSLVAGLEYEIDAFEERLENILFVKDYLQRAYGEKPLDGGEFAITKRNLHQVGVGDSARLRFAPGLYAKASYEWATRMPRPDEFFGDGLLVVENLKLQPETSHNLNLGLTYEAPSTPAGDFRANVTGFGRLADQLILLVPQPSYFVYENVFAARSLGVSGTAGWISPGRYVSLDGNATWQDFRNTSSEGVYGAFVDKRIPNRPYLFANGSARFELSNLMNPRDELALTWNLRYIHKFFRAWEGFGKVDTKDVIASQWVHSLSLTYVTRSDSATLTWSADAQNLTDAKAFDFYGVQRPGRSLFATLTVDFET